MPGEYVPDPIIAVDIQKASRLSGLSQQRLRSWERLGIFSPSHVDETPHAPFGRVYSFRDLVSLRALALISNEGVPLKEIRRAGQYLHLHYESPWAQLRFGQVNRKLVFWDDEQKAWQGADGNAVIEFNVAGIPKEIERQVPSITERTPEEIGEVVSNRYIRGGRPVVAGTRIPTLTIWEYADDGYSPDDIVGFFPQLTLDDVNEALRVEQARHSAA